jgi:hypothetical protein
MPNRSPQPAGAARPSGLRVREPQQSIDSREAASLGSAGSRLVTWRRLVAGLAILLLIDAAVIYWLRMRTRDETPVIAGEIAFGSFEFTRSSGENRVYRGQFDLFIRLSDRLDAREQKQFVREQARLQQAVEETIRRLRLADFTDLRLTRLKNRVQDCLNDELDFEAVEEVLVANFKIAAFRTLPKPAQQSAATDDESGLGESQPLPAD